MKAIILEFLNNFWLLLTAMSMAVLFAVMAATLIKKWLNENIIKEYINPPHPVEQNLFFQVKSSLVGFLLPTCNLEPAATIQLLQRCNLSRSSIQTAMMSKNSIGVESVLPTYAIFGWLFAVYHLLSALILSWLSSLYSLFIQSPPIKVGTGNNSKLGSIPIMVQNYANNIPTQNSIKEMLNDTFKPMAKSLLAGLLIGTIVITLNPTSLTTLIHQSTLLNYLILILLAVPLSFCTITALPIAIALIAIGFSPGAVMLFLIISSCVNLNNIKLLMQNPEGFVRYLYLFSIVIAAILLVIPVDIFLSQHLPDLLTHTLLRGELGFFEQVSAIILLYWTIKLSLPHSSQARGGCGSGCGGD